MARGFEDYNRSFNYGEIAIRPHVLFRTGKMILTDSFEEPVLNWQFKGTGSGSAALTTSKAFHKGASVKLVTQDGASKVAGIIREIGPPGSQKIGFEFAIGFPTAFLEYITITIEHYDGTTVTVFTIRWDEANGKWQFKDSGGSWTDITDGAQNFQAGADRWQRMKLIIDAGNTKYLKLMANEKIFDLSAHTAQSAASALPSRLSCYVQVSTDSANAYTAYIDTCTITEED